MANLCENTGGNTGIGACDLKAPIIMGVIFTPKNAVIPTGTEDLMELLKTQFTNDNKQARWFPLIDSDIQITNSSEDAVVASLSSGYSEKLRNGNAIYQLDLRFSLCKGKIINRFDGWNGGMFLLTKDMQLAGRKQTNGDIAAFLPSSVYTKVNPLGDGQNISLASLIVNFGDSGLFMNVFDITSQIDNFDQSELQGLTDIDLTVVGQASGYVDVKVQTKCGGVDLFDTYSTELANKNVWSLINKSTGAAVVPTTVTAQAATKSFRISATAATYLLSLAAVSVLETNGISGYESNSITVTVS
jgi:hypothetical protein